ncbi:MAG TPA: M48 family metallopeptidase [Geobacteraceae bacterium]|nr:M48 family metallopeptidase [Geobacteraceae bacterium]
MKFALLLFFLLVTTGELALSWLNLQHLKRHGREVPRGFEGSLDPETLQKTVDYTVENNRLGLIETLCGTILVVLFLFCGILDRYDHWVVSHSNAFVLQGLLFFLPLCLLQSILDIPFSLYENFSIEKRYGFNTMPPSLWLTDFIKSTLLSILLITLVIAGAFTLVQMSPHGWWLWVWGLLALLSLAMLYLSPYLIEPLFFHFEPIQSEGLQMEIQLLMKRAGLEVRRVLQVDASRRSTHSNAYFTGIGKVKRIVLFDTLIERLDTREILAVLAHEAGHWKAHHLLKRLIATELVILVACYGAFVVLERNALPPLFGMATVSFPAQLVLLGFILSLVATFFAPISAWFSRRHEREADRFAADLTGTPEALASSLVKMGRDNLANLHPHPLYAALHYSHPPLTERVQTLLARKELQSEN